MKPPRAAIEKAEMNSLWNNPLTRRAVLKTVGAIGAFMVADQVSAQQASTARAKGPLVWLDMDQKELDDAYDQSVYAPNQHCSLSAAV